LSGLLPTPHASEIVASVRRITENAGTVEIDLGGVDEIDPGVVALLGAELRTRGVTFHLHGGDRFHSLFELCTEGVPSEARLRAPEGLRYQVGRKMVLGVEALGRLLGFVGELAAATARVVRRPRVGHWRDVPLLVERAGLDAIPILLVINFLVGFVMAYMAARSLQVFGANIYVANLVAIAMTRQLGPIMTGIVVCGRSGAAFAAELGSMKVAQEIDALRTLGLEPFDWLVLPRIVALLIVMPVLTLLADLVGMAGGLLVAVTSLGLSARGYIDATRRTLKPWDVESGLVMSAAFAVAVGLVACEQGFAASAGPLGVGRRTTSTVVISLFAIVSLDATLTVAFRVLGFS
jgi:phospholipid/cholesterol/gamma-HCH transport system permease protein